MDSDLTIHFCALYFERVKEKNYYGKRIRFSVGSI